MKAWPFRSANGAPCLICQGQQVQLPTSANQNDRKLQPSQCVDAVGLGPRDLQMKELPREAAGPEKEAKIVCLESEWKRGQETQISIIQ